MRIEDVKILEQKAVCGDYRMMKFYSRKIAAVVKPGQFVHLRVAGLNEHVLRRPFSVFKADKKSLSVLYKIVGAGTELMARLRPGAVVSMIGPLGNGFPVPAKNIYPVLVAGGYGSAALYLLAERAPKKGTIIIGGKTSGDILCAEEFKRLNWDVRIATEDGSAGHKGIVTDVLKKWLAEGGRAAQPVQPSIIGGTMLSRPTCHDRRFTSEDPAKSLQRRITLYACGPMGMLKAVAEIALAGSLEAWLSLDKNMGCGVGACLACVQKVRAPGKSSSPESWKWARICTEGPVFECRQIVWE